MRSCYQSATFKATCSTCGGQTPITHIPLSHRGFYCNSGHCCVVCHPPAPTAPGTAVDMPKKHGKLTPPLRVVAA